MKKEDYKMKNILAIYKRELKLYFVSPVFYAVAIIFVVVSGFFFFNFVKDFVAYGFNLAQQAQMSHQGMPKLNMNEWVIRPFMMNTSVILLFFIPAITMRIFAEEKKSGSIELLLTKPITDIQIIIGKYLAAFTLYFCIVAITFIFVLILMMHGTPDFGPLFSGYLGILLMGGVLVALGQWISSLTDNQLIAAFASFGLFLLLFVMTWAARFAGEGVVKVVEYVSIMGHFDDMAKGIIDTKDLIYYLSFIFLALYLNVKSLEALRWRG
jgi:ABC-2 type transport system permease protein